VPGTALAWLLWMFILSRLPAAVAGVASLLTPVIGVLSAWLQLGERPGALEVVGIAFVVAALVFNMLPGFLQALSLEREGA
jgi:drug/metabolite transporter (DMT)-like permease